MIKIKYTLKGASQLMEKFFTNVQVAEGFVETLRGRGKLISMETIDDTGS